MMTVSRTAAGLATAGLLLAGGVVAQTASAATPGQIATAEQRVAREQRDVAAAQARLDSERRQLATAQAALAALKAQPTATPTPTATATPRPTATATATPTATATAGAGERVVKTVYLTGYSVGDNTPRGSSAISNPVLHRVAGGVGTYTDPVTMAVGHTIINGKDVLDIPAGTKVYVPNLRKYLMVEDSCGDFPAPETKPCHSVVRAPQGVTLWMDVWVSGLNSTEAQANSCMSKVTDGSGPLTTVIFEPRPDHIVIAGDISDGATCRAGYGQVS